VESNRADTAGAYDGGGTEADGEGSTDQGDSRELDAKTWRERCRMRVPPLCCSLDHTWLAQGRTPKCK